jgi:long-chain acyl-CoA synthetase
MPAPNQPTTNIIHQFLNSSQKLKDTPLLWEKRRNIYQSLSWKEVASRISSMVRALTASGVKKYDRIINMLPNESSCMIVDYATLTMGAVSTTIPNSWELNDVCDAIAECQSKILFASDVIFITKLLEKENQIPSLEILVIPDAVHVKSDGRIKVLSWSAMMDSGKNTPDKMLQHMRAVSARDAATLTYFKNDEGKLEAIKRNHLEILELCNSVQEQSDNVKLTSNDRFMVTVAHHDPIGIYAGHFLPILLEAQLYYANIGKSEDLDIRNAKPNFIIGSSDYFVPLIEFTLSNARKGGAVDSKAIDKALELGKIKYENPKGLSLIQRGIEASLKTMVINRIRNQLGGNIRGIISVDNKMTYSVQLFFFSFGIDLLEVGQDT